MEAQFACVARTCAHSGNQDRGGRLSTRPSPLLSTRDDGLADRELIPNVPRRKNEKADVFEYAEVFEHVGLLFNGPPDTVGLPFI